MKKYVTLSLAVLASQALASDVKFGASMGFHKSTEAESGLMGLVLNAEHHSELTEETGYFVSSSLFVPPVVVTEGGPRSMDVAVGGFFKSSFVPAAIELGVMCEVVSPAAAEESMEIAPGIVFGALYNMNQEWAIQSRTSMVFPANMQGEYSSASVGTSLGLVRTVPVDA